MKDTNWHTPLPCRKAVTPLTSTHIRVDRINSITGTCGSGIQLLSHNPTGFGISQTQALSMQQEVGLELQRALPAFRQHRRFPRHSADVQAQEQALCLRTVTHHVIHESLLPGCYHAPPFASPSDQAVHNVSCLKRCAMILTRNLQPFIHGVKKDYPASTPCCHQTIPNCEEVQRNPSRLPHSSCPHDQKEQH